MLAVALFNIGVQLSAPRWVAGRSLAAFQASIAGGIAMGSWGWGHLTDLAGVETALLVSAGLMFLSPLLGIWLRMPPVGARNEDATEMLADPEVQLSLTGRSGPLVVEIEYRVAQDNARAFHNVMQDVQLSRQRNGAYGWSIARDIADPELWTERYHCPTWLDYLRQRNRATLSERGRDGRGKQHVNSIRHCPCSVSTFWQGLLIRARFCFRQASTIWSPSFICARQNRETSRAQASWPCCAGAADTATKIRGMAKRNLVILLCLRANGRDAGVYSALNRGKEG